MYDFVNDLNLSGNGTSTQDAQRAWLLSQYKGDPNSAAAQAMRGVSPTGGAGSDPSIMTDTGRVNLFKGQDLPQYDYNSQTAQAQANVAEDRQKTLALAQQLQAQASGLGGPSLAQMQLDQGLQQNQASIASQMASRRGLNPGLAAASAADAQANAGQQAAGQAAQLRAQERLSAQQQLAGVLSGQTGADTGMYGTSGNLSGGQSALTNQNNIATMGANAGLIGTNMTTQAGLKQASDQASSSLWGGIASGVAGAAAHVLPALLAHGGPVDDTSRDTVPAMLSPGEVVLPRSIAQAPDASRQASDFVAALKEMEDGGETKGKGNSAGLIKALRSKQSEIEQRMHRLEMAFGGSV
jgi:hypothetical protein